VGSPLRDVVLARARDDVRAVIAWSLADDTWDFVHAEQAFGDGDDAWPPLRLDVSGAPLLVRGKIDRIDVEHDGGPSGAARAIDYKSSKRAADNAAREQEDGAAFQVPLYALVAARALARARADGLYLPTTGRELRGERMREVPKE